MITLDTLRYGLTLLHARANQKPHAQRMTDGERAALQRRIIAWQAVIDALDARCEIPRALWTEATFMEGWADAHQAWYSKQITHEEFLTVCNRLHEARLTESEAA